jgi:hypothetical protein
MSNPLEQFKKDMARLAFGAAPADVPGCCIQCREPFSDKNVFTDAGRRETKISGLCEKCWDELFKEEE